jgi:zinc transporter ZupT
VLGVALWALAVPLGRRFSDDVMRGITVFGGAYLLGVCILGLMPEVADMYCDHRDTDNMTALLPFGCILVGFIVQQLLESLSAHAEHGHVEDHKADAPVLGLMLGLCLHAFLEGMPLVDAGGEVNRGLFYGMLIHNIPVSLILVALLTARRKGFWTVVALLLLFGAMSPLGSLFNLYVVRPDEDQERMIIGMVIGVLLHVSSSILFDHKRHGFSWLGMGLTVAAFAAAYFTVN